MRCECENAKMRCDAKVRIDANAMRCDAKGWDVESECDANVKMDSHYHP
jgi:hypothetical protein